MDSSDDMEVPSVEGADSNEMSEVSMDDGKDEEKQDEPSTIDNKDQDETIDEGDTPLSEDITGVELVSEPKLSPPPQPTVDDAQASTTATVVTEKASPSTATATTAKMEAAHDIVPPSEATTTTTSTTTTSHSNVETTQHSPRVSFFMKNKKSKEIFERWGAKTAHLSVARTIASTLFLIHENIISFVDRPLRSNKILVVLEKTESNLLKTEEKAFAMAQFTREYDLAPDLPYNGFRSLLNAYQQCLEKIHEALVECKASRDSLFFNADNVYSVLEDYGTSMLSAWWVILVSALRLHEEVLQGKRYFCKPSENKIAQDILKVSRFADVSAFYGGRAACHLPDAIAVTMRVILVAMCGFKSQFNNTKKHNFFMKNITSALEAVKYLISPEDHSHQLVAQLRTRSIPFVKAFWNLTESTFARNMPKVTGPLLGINHVRYIKAQCLIHQGPHGPVTVIPDIVSDLLYKKLKAQADTSKDGAGEEVMLTFYSTILFGYVQKLEACTTKEKLLQQSALVKKEVDAYKTKGALSDLEYKSMSRILYRMHNLMLKHLKIKNLHLQPGEIHIIDKKGGAPSTMFSSAQQKSLSRQESASVFSEVSSPTTALPTSTNDQEASPSDEQASQLDVPNSAEAKVLGKISHIRLGSTADIEAPQSPIFTNIGTRFGSIKTRLLSYKRLDGQLEGKSGGLTKSPWLIFHIHGGGFVANSSQSHEVYLRGWAKTFGFPIFSIDYALAPEHPYPRPIQECFYAYVWALNNASELGWTGEKVLVCGDSAGGNLTVALTLRCIAEGIRLPNAIMPIYPALNVNMEISSSRILTMIDVLLSQGILETCLAAYSNNPVEQLDKIEITDMFMSPVLAPNEFLQKLPFTTVIALAYDPLLDDSLEFVKRLKELNVKHNFQVLEHVPHGFLNFKDVSRETLAAHDVIVKHLQHIFETM